MKKVLGSVTKIVFSLFGLAILGLLMSLTYQALGRVFPNNFETQMWGLVLFDIAAMAWALCFAFYCETVAQYAVAAIGFLTGFVGTLIMVASEVLLGQNLTPIQTQEIGRWMVYGFIGATVIHAALIYSHHGTGKEIRQQIDVGIARGEITSEAIKQATAQLDVEKINLANALRQDIVSQAKRDLGLYPVEGTPFEPKKYETQPLPVTWAKEDAITADARPLSRQAGLPPFFRTFKDWVSDLRKRTAALSTPAPTPAPAPAPEAPKEVSGPDWEIVNQKLEEVKQDLLRARDMLLPNYHPDWPPQHPNAPTEAPQNPAEQSK